MVNVARGALMDEEAVADLLEEGWLRGAVLDVFTEEPLPATSRSGASDRRSSSRTCRRCRRGDSGLGSSNSSSTTGAATRTGGRLRNLVDKHAGY